MRKWSASGSGCPLCVVIDVDIERWLLNVRLHAGVSALHFETLLGGGDWIDGGADDVLREFLLTSLPFWMISTA